MVLAFRLSGNVAQYFSAVLGLTISTTTLSYVAIFPALYLLRRRMPHVERPYRAPGGNGGALTIDLSDAYASYIQSLGTSGEYIAVGCLVNTYLTAFGADTVSITVNGAPLESGHNVYDMPLEFYTDSTNS